MSLKVSVRIEVMAMQAVYANSLPFGVLNEAGEFFKICAAGELEKLESFLLKNNENIYKPVDYFGSPFVPLFAALCGKNEKIVNLLLDLYERDLEACAGTKSRRVLLALPEDQTEEFWKTVENEVSEDLQPVLVKNERNENMKTVFLRRQLEDKDDLSYQIAKDLEAKNGVCDFLWRPQKFPPEDSLLHAAVHNEMKTVVQRIFDNKIIDVKTVNCNNHNPLHCACAASLEMVKLLLSSGSFENFHEDPSYLYQAAYSGKAKVVEFIIDSMVQHGKLLEEILKISFMCQKYDEKLHHDHMFHLIAKSGNFDFFIKNHQNYSDEDFCIQNSEEETILHILVISCVHKLNFKIKLISQIIKQHPKLLLIKDRKGRLPLHFAAFCDVLGQKLFKHVLKQTIEASGNPEIFFEDVEVAVETLEHAIDMNKGLSEDYLQNFQKLLSSHGARLLQKTISCNKSMKGLKGILSSEVKVNPNEFYNGTNAFLTMLRFDIERLYSWKPGQETFKRFKMLTKYHAVDNFDARDATGTTLFMYLVGFCEDLKFLRSLIVSGADCNANNDKNVTCLHFAATNCKNKEIVKLLIENGADPNAFDDSKKLPLNYAMSAENVDGVNVLLYYFPAESLKLKFGPKKESLIQCGVQIRSDMISQYVWDTYRDYDVKIDVNETNNAGENLPMIALSSLNPEKLDAIFSGAFEEIDFNHRDNAGETFTHKFALHQQMMQHVPLFEKFPKLRVIVNNQIFIANNEGETPMDDLIALYEHDDWISEGGVDAFVELISLENIKAAFHRLCISSKMLHKMLEKFPEILNEMKWDEALQALEKAAENPETYKILLKKLVNKFADDNNDKNRLHIVCKVNSAELIDFTLKTMTAGEVASLSGNLDKDLKTPFEVLNGENKFLFKKVLFLK